MKLANEFSNSSPKTQNFKLWSSDSNHDFRPQLALSEKPEKPENPYTLKTHTFGALPRERSVCIHDRKFIEYPKSCASG